MGVQVDRTIGSLFKGVSQQPDSVKLEGQVNDAVNCWLDITASAVEKRPGTTYRCLHDELWVGPGRPKLYGYKRDENEQYTIVVHGSSVSVNDKEGIRKFLMTEVDYLNCPNPAEDIKMLTVGDTTFIVNRTVTVQPNGVEPGFVGGALSYTIDTVDPTYGSYTLSVSDSSGGFAQATAGAHTSSADAAEALRTSLTAVKDADWRVDRRGSTVTVVSTTNRTLSATADDFQGGRAAKLVCKQVTSTSDLPRVFVDNAVIQVGKEEEDSIWMKFYSEYTYTQNTNESYWIEVPKPGTANSWYSPSLPRKLTRLPDGTFSLTSLQPTMRQGGYNGDIFTPKFVNNKIENLALHRDRLIFFVGEYLQASAQGDYFRFFPESTTQVLDSDPFSRIASTDEYAALTHSATYRGKLFCMSVSGQFELLGNPTLTPKSADLELATQYPANVRVAPVTLGSQLYFTQTHGDHTILWEYYFSEGSVSHTANDVSIHAKGYVPGNVIEMAADVNSGTIYMLTEGDPTSLYVYRTFHDGSEKILSAWFRYQYRVPIHSIMVLDGKLLILSRLRTRTWSGTPQFVLLESHTDNTVLQIPNSGREVHLDYLSKVVFKEQASVNDEETAIRTEIEMLSDQAEPTMAATPFFVGRKSFTDEWIFMPLTKHQLFPFSYVVPMPLLEVAKYDSYVGYQYDSYIDLPSPYMLDDNGKAITYGRLQINQLQVQYEKTGTFYVESTNGDRPAKRNTFNASGRGGILRLSNLWTTLSGVFKTSMRGRGETLKVRIGNNTYEPFKIIAYRWRGFFNKMR